MFKKRDQINCILLEFLENYLLVYYEYYEWCIMNHHLLHIATGMQLVSLEKRAKKQFSALLLNTEDAKSLENLISAFWSRSFLLNVVAASLNSYWVTNCN